MMKRKVWKSCVVLVMAMCMAAQAATVAYWDFEDGTPGVTFAAAGGSADVVNGIIMYGFDDTYGPAFSAEGDTPTGEGLSCELDGGQDGYTLDTNFNTWSPSVWTIEVSAFLEDIGGWKTLIGRDGSASGQAGADFYLSNNDVDDRFRIDVVTVGGTRWQIDSDFVPVANQWYHIAVVSDGVTMTMYCDQLDGNGYQDVGSLDISAQSVADNALAQAGFNWTFGRGWYDGAFVDHITGNLDNIRFSDTALMPSEFLFSNVAAYDPAPKPLNVDGTVGTLVGNQAEVTLNFKAGPDPDGVYDVNPDIVSHYIYLSGGADDPNLTLLATVDQTSLTDPCVSFGPILLDNNTEYLWRVEEGIDDGTGNASPPGDPNNFVSATWSFTTVAATPSILSGPVNTVADANGDATFSVQANATTNGYQWFKVGDPDVQLSDGSKYSGTQSSELTVMDVTLADEEEEFYCIGYNNEIPSEPSPTARLWQRRLVGHWKLDGNLLDSVAETVPGAPAHDGVLTVHNTITGPGDMNYASDVAETGIDGNAAWFFNDGDFVEIPDPCYFNFYHAGLTVSCWYKMDVTAGWRHPVIRLETGNPDISGFLFGIDTAARQDCRFIFENALGWPGLNSDDAADPVAYNDGEWHMMTATYDPVTNTARFYGDGVLADEASVDFEELGLEYPDAPLRIGGSNLADNPAVQGGVDDVRIYTYALTPSEVAGLYTQTTPEEDYICVVDPADPLEFDLNGDCIVSLPDFALLAGQWLECDRIPVEACAW